MTASQCPHGIAQGTCEICRVLETGSTESVPDRKPGLVSGRLRRGSGRLSLGVGAVLVVVILVVVSQVIAVVWSVFHLFQLVAVAAVAGWIGWKAGVAYGRRIRP